MFFQPALIYDEWIKFHGKKAMVSLSLMTLLSIFFVIQYYLFCLIFKGMERVCSRVRWSLCCIGIICYVSSKGRTGKNKIVRKHFYNISFDYYFFIQSSGITFFFVSVYRKCSILDGSFQNCKSSFRYCASWSSNSQSSKFLWNYLPSVYRGLLSVYFSWFILITTSDIMLIYHLL